MTNYRRSNIAGASYFFTVNLADRSQTLLIEHIDLLRSAFEYTRERHPFIVDAIAVLPEHLHAIWTLPDGDNDFALRWRLIKTVFSRGVSYGGHVPTAGNAKASVESGSGAIGSTSSATRQIFHGMSITSISTRSSTAWCCAWQSGRIRHFIVTCKPVFCRRIGRAMRELSWIMGRGTACLVDGYRCAQPILRGLDIWGGFKFEVQQPVFAWCSLATPRRIPRVAF